MIDERPIGVFDSGIGGLTVLEVLMEKFPNENFIYLADTYNCPYGEKSKEEVAKIVKENALFLNNIGIKALVIACNTATSNAEGLDKFLDVPIIGVIEPTANYAIKETKNKNILVLATNLTIETGSYQKYLEDFYVTSVKASEFVKLVEEGKYQEEESFLFIANKLKIYMDKDIDTVILGCTHFPLLKMQIQAVFPKAVLVSSGLPTAEKLAEAILKNKETNKQNLIVFTTGKKDNLLKQITWFRKKIDFIQEVNI